MVKAICIDDEDAEVGESIMKDEWQNHRDTSKEVKNWEPFDEFRQGLRRDARITKKDMASWTLVH